MAVKLPSAAPPNALKVWTDGIRLFAEVGGYPVAFSLSEGGLSEVLNLISERRVDYSGQPIYKPEPKRTVGTELQHAQAEAIMRRMGII